MSNSELTSMHAAIVIYIHNMYKCTQRWSLKVIYEMYKEPKWGHVSSICNHIPNDMEMNHDPVRYVARVVIHSAILSAV